MATSDLTSEHMQLATKSIPILLFLFVFCLVIDNAFKIMSVQIAKDFEISASLVSYQATLILFWSFNFDV